MWDVKCGSAQLKEAHRVRPSADRPTLAGTAGVGSRPIIIDAFGPRSSIVLTGSEINSRLLISPS